MPESPRSLRIVHVSDIHVWRYARNPLQLFSKRLWGMASLLAGRARKFRLERLREVVERVQGLNYDHLLITGDLTTTALPVEFRAAQDLLDPWLADVDRVTILPGNHDRYTFQADRHRVFESYFGRFAPRVAYPWLRGLDHETAILGLDPTRAGITAKGKLSTAQLEEARALITSGGSSLRRLIIACHYPIEAPEEWREDLVAKRLVNADQVAEWLSTLGPHLFCCGHVHAAWAFHPRSVPQQLCINAGAPLLHDPTGRRPPGFVEIVLDGDSVSATHHFWSGQAWTTNTLRQAGPFFGTNGPSLGGSV
jgi:3',5'-cyclic AMP phosphodiesterase CpdA